MRKKPVSVGIVKTEAEVTAFSNQYKNLIYWVMRQKRIPECDHDVLYSNILIKFATGRFNYNPAKGMMSTYVAKITLRASKGYLRSANRHSRLFTADDSSAERVCDEHTLGVDDSKGITLLIIEGLCRLSASVKDKQKVRIFLEYLQSKGEITLKSIQEIAAEYKETATYVSCNCSSRLMPKFQQILTQVIAEEQAGNLQLGDWKSLLYLAEQFRFRHKVFEQVLVKQALEKRTALAA